VIDTNLSGDKVGSAGNSIITHSTTKFNPNVNIVINKKSTPKPVKPTESNSETSINEDLLEIMQMDDEESSSTTFILIAGVIIVLIFVALFAAKMALSKRVTVAHQRAAEIKSAEVKSF
jgi:hypothetical protein